MLEYKSNAACELKYNDDEWLVEGYAASFGGSDFFNDTIIPGAFVKSLAARPGNVPIMRFEHLRWVIPGKWDTAIEDEKGLRMTGHLTRGHSVAEDLRASMRHGTIKGLSIGFNPVPGGFDNKASGGRILREINLVEVSFTHDPADKGAMIDSFKSALEEVQTIRDMELFLRESGNFSKSMAIALISHVKSLCRSESEQETAARLRKLEAAMQLKAVAERYDLRKLLSHSRS